MKSPKFASFLTSPIKRRGGLTQFLSPFARKISSNRVLLLDYPVNSTPRWTNDNSHPELYDIINGNRAGYVGLLESFLSFKEKLLNIPARPASGSSPSEPCWINGWM